MHGRAKLSAEPVNELPHKHIAFRREHGINTSCYSC